MTSSKPFQIQLHPSEMIFSNFEELAGDNSYIRLTESISTFFDFESQSIVWFVEMGQLESQFPNINFRRIDWIDGQAENFVFTLFFVFGLENEWYKMN